MIYLLEGKLKLKEQLNQKLTPLIGPKLHKCSRFIVVNITQIKISGDCCNKKLSRQSPGCRLILVKTDPRSPLWCRRTKSQGANPDALCRKSETTLRY